MKKPSVTEKGPFDRGALRVTTGTHTGRSPKDKFIVDTPLTHDVVNWNNNQPCSQETFDRLYAKCEEFIKTHKVYVKNVKAGADPKYQIRVKFINEMAWQTVFVSQLFIKTDEPSTVQEDFTVISLPAWKRIRPRTIPILKPSSS